MKTKSFILILFFCIYVFCGCKKDITGPDNSIPGISGKIVDIYNNPVPDADIHYIWYSKSNPILQTAGVQFGVPSDQKLTIKMINLLGKEVVLLSDQKFYQRGTYIIPCAADKISNGIYNFTVQGETFNSKTESTLKSHRLVKTRFGSDIGIRQH